MKWITREKVKVDRVACPWLIKKFVDPAAEFIFLPHNTDWASVRDGTVYDVPGCELGHHGEEVSFDAILRKHGRIIGPELGSNERDHALKAKPEIFIQTRYSVAPVDGSGTAFDPNLRLSRIETRWAGKIND